MKQRTIYIPQRCGNGIEIEFWAEFSDSWQLGDVADEFHWAQQKNVINVEPHHTWWIDVGIIKNWMALGSEIITQLLSQMASHFTLAYDGHRSMQMSIQIPVEHEKFKPRTIYMGKSYSEVNFQRLEHLLYFMTTVPIRDMLNMEWRNEGGNKIITAQ